MYTVTFSLFLSPFLLSPFLSPFPNTNKKEALALIRKSLGMQSPAKPTEEEQNETAAEKILRLTGLDITRCPKCGGILVAASLPLPERPP